MYSIELNKRSERFIKKLNKKDAEIILKKIYSIRENPFPHLKRLQGLKLWRLRVMDYRAIIDIIISGRKIVVLKINHRKHAYQKLS